MHHAARCSGYKRDHKRTRAEPTVYSERKSFLCRRLSFCMCGNVWKVRNARRFRANKLLRHHGRLRPFQLALEPLRAHSYCQIQSYMSLAVKGQGQNLI